MQLLLSWFFLFFLDVAHRQMNDFARVAVGKAVIEHLTLAADGDQAGLPERLQLIGHGAGRHAQRLCERAGAQLALVQRQQNLEPRICPDRPEKLGERRDVLVAGHVAPDKLRRRAIA